MTTTEKKEKLNDIIKNSNRIVFFGGAGVSTESGIPDFRSKDGLYNQEYDFQPETILSHTFFVNKCEEFYRFYRNKMIFREAKPNATHIKLAELEEMGKLLGIVTQNIDGLHQLAGSKNVQELHGSVHRNYCVKCGRAYGVDAILNSSGIPHCECGGIIKPDVVLYEESLPEKTVENALKLISNADTLIIGGTSLAVYPAAGFVRYFAGDNLIIINKSGTSMDENADLLIHDSLGAIFADLHV